MTAAQGHRIGSVISESRYERVVSDQEHLVDPGVWTLGVGSTIESRICTVHVVLAAHIAVSIAFAPRNKMSRRCRQGTACGVGTGGRKKEAEAKRD
jgi:hypothetical protein